MMDSQDKEQWHMKKEINIAHVIITVSMVITTMWFFADLDKRITGNTKDIAHVQEQRTEDSRRMKVQRDEDNKRIEKQFDKINTKLDRLLAK